MWFIDGGKTTHTCENKNLNLLQIVKWYVVKHCLLPSILTIFIYTYVRKTLLLFILSVEKHRLKTIIINYITSV